MGGRFMRGLVWGGLLGAVVGAYLMSSRDGRFVRYTLRRRLGGADRAGGELAARRPSRLQLALDAGRAAMDATLALLGRRA